MRRRKSRSYHVPTLVLLALVPLSGGVWMASGRVHGPVQRVADSALSPLAEPGSAVSRFLSDVPLAAGGLLRSGQETRELEGEVARLRAQVALLEDRLREKSQSEAGLQSFLQQRNAAPDAEYLTSAAVIEAAGIMAWPVARDASSWRYSVLVNRGTEHGVRPGAAVTSGGALVGEVKTAGGRSSRVLLICDPHARVPVRFLGLGSPEKAVRVLPADRAPAQGLLAGVRPGLCRVLYVPRDAQVALGDTVVTSGLDGRFPSGLLVGKVTGTKKQELFLDVEVSPSVPAGALRALLVLRPKNEPESPQTGSPGVAQRRPDAAQERQIHRP